MSERPFGSITRMDHLNSIESAHALMQASADSMFDPQVLLEAVRGPDGGVIEFRYLSVNRAACDYLGYRESDLVGRTHGDFSPNGVGRELQRRFVQCLEDGQPVDLQDFAGFNSTVDAARRYDIKATRAGADVLCVTWRDVTERFREAEYRLIAENSTDAVLHARNGRVVWISPSIEGILGAPAEYWIGRELTEAVSLGDLQGYERRMKTLAEGTAIQERVQLVAADGTTHWLHLHAKAYFDAHGNQDGLVAALRLIDDEVAAEVAAGEARRQQARADARFRNAMANAAIGVSIVTPSGAFIGVNAAMCELCGYDAETLLQKTWQELTPPEFLEADLQNVADILAGRSDSYRMLKQYVRADGRRIWCDLAVSCVRDDDGQVETLVSQVADVTAEVEAREELERSNERIRVLARSLQEQSDRMASELRSAADYLASIMPRELAGPVTVESRYLPSQEVGGDCFDFSWIDDDHLLVYLIDVSGHGIEPALLSVSVHNMLRSGSLGIETLVEPDVVLTELNRLFQMDRQGDHYFTVWYGVYQASTRTLRYAAAGAPPAFAFHPPDGDGSTLTELSTSSLPVGMFEDAEFTNGCYAVPRGCRILIFSDGAYEIALGEGELLAFAEFEELNIRRAESSRWALAELVDELTGLSSTGAFEDDCSLIQLTFD